MGTIIGETREGSGVSGLYDDGLVNPLTIMGWSYYSRLEHDLTKGAFTSEARVP